MYVQLLRTIYPAPGGNATSFVAVTTFWDTDTRTYYRTQTNSTTNDPAELAEDTEVQRFEVRPGLTHIVRYAGNGTGQVYTQKLITAGQLSTNLSVVVNPTTTFAAGIGTLDGSVDATGSQGLPPYQLALLSGGTVVQTGVTPSAFYSHRFVNLDIDTYTVRVTDATGAVATQDFTVIQGVGVGRGVTLEENYTGDPVNGNGYRYVYLYNDQTVARYDYVGGGLDGDHYQAAPGLLVDEYLLPDGVTRRRVYADGSIGSPGVYFVDENIAATSLASSGLALDNLIYFDPDAPTTANGGFLLEMTTTAPPCVFTLPGHTGQPQPDGLSGSFDGLGPGEYVVQVSDQTGATVQVPVSLRVQYGKRWQLVFDSLDSVPCRVELWTLGYAGAVEAICGQESPVVLRSDGLSSLGGQGDIPAAIGRSAEMHWLVPAGTFQAVVAGLQATDRFCRCDVYYDDALEFRGFVQPDIYHAPLLDGWQTVDLLATDGLAALKDTYFTGHLGQRLAGHRPWLNTLLHCLSRCTVALPVRLYTNRRDAAMDTSDAPELAATSNRTGYWSDDKDEPIDARTVLDALCQALGGTLCQRAGAWDVRPSQEAAGPLPGRAYRPAGSQAATYSLTAPAPSGTVARAPTGGPGWWWEGGGQAMQVRAGWKSLAGKTDTGWLKNAYPAGKVFSDRYSWLDDETALRGTSQWTAHGRFALALLQAGKKGNEYVTAWQRALPVDVPDPASYLEGPQVPLVPGGEAVPAYLRVTAQVVGSETYRNLQGGQSASPTTAPVAFLPWTLLVDGQELGSGVIQVKADDESTPEVALGTLPVGTRGAVLRLGAWYAPDTNILLLTPQFMFGVNVSAGDVVTYTPPGGTLGLYVALQGYNVPAGAGTGIAPSVPAFWAQVTATNHATGTLIIKEVAVQLRPREGTWEGEDNFRADGPAGTVRPTDALSVYHADVPIAAGLFGGNLHAFGKAVGLLDGTMSTQWKRAVDRRGSPLFESNVYDVLALRGAPSRLLTGTLRFRGLAPPRMLDSVDPPTDTPGRRYWVVADEWSLKEATTVVSLVEIGRGAGAPNPATLLPAGVRYTHEVYAYNTGQYAPYVRRTHDGGVRVWHL